MTQAKKITDAINQHLSDHYETLNKRGLRSVRVHVYLNKARTEVEDVVLSPDWLWRNSRGSLEKD